MQDRNEHEIVDGSIVDFVNLATEKIEFTGVVLGQDVYDTAGNKTSIGDPTAWEVVGHADDHPRYKAVLDDLAAQS